MPFPYCRTQWAFERIFERGLELAIVERRDVRIHFDGSLGPRAVVETLQSAT